MSKQTAEQIIKLLEPKHCVFSGQARIEIYNELVSLLDAKGEPSEPKQFLHYVVFKEDGSYFVDSDYEKAKEKASKWMSKVLYLYTSPPSIDVVDKQIESLQRDVKFWKDLQENSESQRNAELQHDVESLQREIGELKSTIAKYEDALEKAE